MQKNQSQTKKQLLWEIFRFLLVGGTATLVDYITFGIFDALLFPLVFPADGVWQTVALTLSTALGFCVGLTVNWLLSVLFVFRQTQEKISVTSKKEFLAFAVIGLVGLALTELGVVLLVWVLPELTIFGATTLMGTAWEKWLAKAVMTALVLVWNYLARKKFIFR